MRKQKLKFVAILMILVICISALPVGAAWDRLQLEDDSVPEKPTSSAYPYSSIKSKIKEYQAVNDDVVGWLKVPGTSIDEPILLSDVDNDYYVYRDWKGQKYSNITYLNYVDTATYLDYRTKIGSGWKNGTSKNLVFYGHNWNNLRAPFVIGNKAGYSMFAQLPSYTDGSFAKENSHIYFSTGENEGIWRVFSVAYCELSTEFFYNNPNPSTEKYQALLDEWKTRSLFNFGVDVSTSDRLITLSTCTRQYSGQGNGQRFVVIARLLRDGESEDDNVTISVNSNVKEPAFS